MDECKVVANDITLVQTCSACPEQYDAYYKGMIVVGYLRLRWGYFSVRCPDYNGEEVYSTNLKDGWSGCFKDSNQRQHHLHRARKAIAKYLNSHKEALRP